jgi:hypothetical protein
MKVSKRSIEALLDLVEIKLSTIEVTDREDERERAKLETARDELLQLKSLLAAQKKPARAIAAQPDPVQAAALA